MIALGRSIRSRWTRRAVDPQLWTWGAVIGSALLVGVLSWLHSEQRRTLARTVTAVERVRQARIELSQGFLHTMLGGKPELPFDRGQGLALLRQAAASTERAAIEGDAGVAAGFADDVRAFHSLLAQWSGAATPSLQLETRLRLAFHRLEGHAEAIDEATRERLRQLSVRQRSEFGWTLAAAAALLAGLCGALFVAGRSRQASEVALHQSRELFKTLADISPVGIFRADARGRCLYVNARWSEICGFSAEQAMGDGWLAAIDPEDRDRLRRDWMEAVRQRRSLAREYRMRRPDGVAVWVLGQVAAEHGPGGTGTSYVGTITDITAQKRAAETHLRSQKLEALGTLAGGIAHDFNNLLLAISGNTKLAVEELPSEHSAQESLKEIEKASARAAELVRRILTFSRAEEHKREVVELRPVVEEALQLLRATLPARIEIRADLSADVPAVAADSTQIHQIIINLATNSAHAIGEQAGLIELRLDPDQPSPELDDTLTGLGGRRWARLSVRDTGCGMDRETLGRIFDPFFTTKPPGQGTGLGLSLVHSIVARHDGAINVSSEPGQGTTFRLYFPGVDAIAATAAVEPPEPRDARSGHVLYVDDEEALVLLVSRTLKRRGYRVTACSNPAEALARFTLQPGDFDAVVTDLSMPGMSGFDLGSAILAVRPDVPIVMTSGYFRPEDQRRAEETGIRELILKPDTVEELWRSLDRLLGKPEVAS